MRVVPCILISLLALGLLSACGPKGDAQMAMITRDFGQAAKLYEDYVANNPDDVTARRHLGKAYMHTGRYDEAIEQFLEATKLDWDEWESDFYAATTYLCMGKDDRIAFAVVDHMVVPFRFTMKKFIAAGTRRVARRWEEPATIIRKMEDLKRDAERWDRREDRDNDSNAAPPPLWLNAYPITPPASTTPPVS
jgi:tetratricopeptide (TPR) repeat protein